MEIIEILKNRFVLNRFNHKNISWYDIEKRLINNPEKLSIIKKMEDTGGEVDLIIKDHEYYFVDCSKESPKLRTGLCYDKEARVNRKNFPPSSSVMEMLEEIGSELLDEAMYRYLQSLDDFDLKTSSWIKTPIEIRKLKGALFMDKRYNTTFVYHNSADSYYSSRGFRTMIKI